MLSKALGVFVPGVKASKCASFTRIGHDSAVVGAKPLGDFHLDFCLGAGVVVPFVDVGPAEVSGGQPVGIDDSFSIGAGARPTPKASGLGSSTHDRLRLGTKEGHFGVGTTGGFRCDLHPHGASQLQVSAVRVARL